MKYPELRRLIREGIRSILVEADEETSTPEKSDTSPVTPEVTPATPVTNTLNRSAAKQMIKDTKGKFFTVSFIKRTDGTRRVMNARLGVKAFLKGGTLPYDPEAKRLIPVYDVQKRAYRMINVDTIFNLKIGQQEYNVR
jgi:hypothetical protein